MEMFAKSANINRFNKKHDNTTTNSVKLVYSV